STGYIKAVDFGIFIESNNVVLTNDGTILSTSTISNRAAVKVVSQQSATITNTNKLLGSYGIIAGGFINNSGTIHGSISCGAIYGGTVTNSGTFAGGVGIKIVSGTSATIIDIGTIAGTSGTAISFAALNDLLKFNASTSANIQGTVNGGGGTDTLE